MIETVLLPNTGMTLQQARDKLSGWHFSKELLTHGERGILYVAEALLRLIDEMQSVNEWKARAEKAEAELSNRAK